MLQEGNFASIMKEHYIMGGNIEGVGTSNVKYFNVKLI